MGSPKKIKELPPDLVDLNARITACERCPRLAEHCRKVAEVRRRAYADQVYWGRPVPSFGDPEARVLLVGLAPGAHGANRTGRMFTGDSSGDFLYPVLHQSGFATQAESVSRDDGLRLRDMWMTARGHCAPPDNKPLPEELARCAPFLDEEIGLLRRLRVFVCLGGIAFDGVLLHLQRASVIARRSEYVFSHGAEYRLPDGRWLLASYHPSRQNTNTGRLTAEMLQAVLDRARALATKSC